jgi:hypothetical protein
VLLADWPRLQLLARWLVVGLGLLGSVFYVIHALIEYLDGEALNEKRINGWRGGGRRTFESFHRP